MIKFYFTLKYHISGNPFFTLLLLLFPPITTQKNLDMLKFLISFCFFFAKIHFLFLGNFTWAMNQERKEKPVNSRVKNQKQ